MINFAEELAHLYFRLNGFFLIDNYVIHANEHDGKQNTDSDILGIRPKNVSEYVGLKSNNDIDQKLINIFDKADFIGLISEIKGGVSSSWKINNNKLRPCIKRLGLSSIEKLDEIRDALANNPDCTITENGINMKFIKIVVSDEDNNGGFNNWHHISLQNMERFILSRLKSYKDKQGSWHFNNSTLFQYIIYKNRNITRE